MMIRMESSELQVEWGRRIRKLRRDKELTVSEVARKIGIHRNHLHRIEGGAACSDEVRLRIADALGVKPEEIFTFKLRSAS